MKEFKYTIQDQLGIHARPAGMFVKEAASFPCAITIEKNGKSADARRLLAVMSLGVKRGEEVIVRIEGEQEEEAAARLETFFRENL